MFQYHEDRSLKEGLSQYLKQYNLGDGGYNDTTFKIPFLYFFSLTLPNIPSRVRAVKLHDLHHVLTGYETKLIGEAEIGAWEIASGCGSFYAAWILNLGSFIYGMFLCPRRLFNAYIRGRRSKNLYHGIDYAEVLAIPLCNMRRTLHIPDSSSHGPARASDFLSFSLWCAISLWVIVLPLAMIFLLVHSLI